MMRVIGAFVLTYFLSRALRWAGLRAPSVSKLIGAHVLSFVLLALLVIALRQPNDVFRVPQLAVYVLAQAAWLLLDLYRAQVAFWKPPVSTVTVSPPAKRAGNSR
jgi:hypothetical protein